MEKKIFEFMIPTQNAGNMDDKLKKLNSRCKRLKANELEIVKGEMVWNGKKEIMYVPYTVTGEIAHINNWKIVAKIEYNEKGSLIHKLDKELKLPEKYNGSNNGCEHCSHNRARKHLYIIQNQKTTEFMQIGKSCLSLYFERSISYELSSYEILLQLDGLSDLEFCEQGFGNIHQVYNVKEFLPFVFRAIKKQGRYYNAQHADYYNEKPTRVVAEEMYVNAKVNNEKPMQEELDKVNELIEWVTNQEINANDNEFLYNVKVIMNRKVAIEKELGYICGVVSYYFIQKKKEMEAKKKAEKQATMKNEYYNGECDDKIQDEVTLDSTFSFDSYYGTSHCLKFVNSEGLLLVTFTTSKKLMVIKVGNKLKIKGIIKGFEEYKGQKQTTLKNVNIIK